MYIGVVSRLTGASAKAIRHYEQLGLLPEAERKGSYRVYGEQEIQMIHLIREAQKLGFKLSEMKSAINQKQKLPSWQKIRCVIDQKIRQIEQDIAELTKSRQQLLHYGDSIDACLRQDPSCSTYTDTINT